MNPEHLAEGNSPQEAKCSRLLELLLRQLELLKSYEDTGEEVDAHQVELQELARMYETL